jgi:hypothetical protein
MVMVNKYRRKRCVGHVKCITEPRNTEKYVYGIAQKTIRNKAAPVTWHRRQVTLRWRLQQ